MKLPTSVIVFGILGILFGALGLCGTVAGVVSTLIVVNPDDPILNVLAENPVAQVYIYISHGVSFLSCLWLLTASVGLLLRSPMARTAAVLYGWFAIVVGLLSTVATYFLVTGPALKAIKKMPGDPAEKMVLTAGLLGGTCGGVVGLIFPVLLIYFMTRPKVLAAFGVTASDGDAHSQAFRSDTGNPYQSPG